jgi:pimeloyl-ACP methyl ester carboxylesterase
MNKTVIPGRPAIETNVVLNDFRYAGQLWGEEGGLPVLAVHGWLDNSASYEVLAPLLPGVQLLAPDLAGHGYTDHRKGLSDYPVWSETAELFALADTMGWERFALIGHSRGAMMAMLLAAAFPERISHLVLLDALVPPPVSASQAPERMVKSIEEMQRRLKRKRSCHPSYEAAIQARCNSEFGQVSQASAEILASRGLVKLEQGYHWHADGKLWASSTVGLTAEQIQAFIQRITAKTLVLLGKQGLKTKIIPGSTFEGLLQGMIKHLDAEVQEFDDGHFLHMEASAKDVGEAIHSLLFEK